LCCNRNIPVNEALPPNEPFEIALPLSEALLPLKVQFVTVSAALAPMAALSTALPLKVLLPLKALPPPTRPSRSGLMPCA
jgi:hypothetical protein